MAKEESEFQKLLSEAPAAPSADIVTVTGALSRTADSAHFVLTLPDGRSVTLEVAAVKSARRIAGAVGQSLVELELDAKRVPDKVNEILKIPFADLGSYTIWYRDTAQTIAYLDQHITGVKDIVGDPTIVETIGAGGTTVETIGAGGIQEAGLAPFAAAMPHQAHSHAQRPVIKAPFADPQGPPKSPAHDGTNPSQTLDITGFGGFDVITYPHGQPTYTY